MQQGCSKIVDIAKQPTKKDRERLWPYFHSLDSTGAAVLISGGGRGRRPPPGPCSHGCADALEECFL